MNNLSWKWIVIGFVVAYALAFVLSAGLLLPRAGELMEQGLSGEAATEQATQEKLVFLLIESGVAMCAAGWLVAKKAPAAKYVNALVMWGLMTVVSVLTSGLGLLPGIASAVIDLGGTLGGAWFAQRQ